jgi:hypothetical protein
MKKTLLLTATSVLLVTTPVFAEHQNNGSQEHKLTMQQVVTISPTNTPKTCSPDETWENHGGYVSCVAKQHLGGQVTSVAAKSSIGKHEDNDGDDDDVTPTVSPSVTPSVTPTDTPSITPTDTPSLTPTESPTETPTVTPSITPTGTEDQTGANLDVLQPFKSLINNLAQVFTSLSTFL